MFLESIVKSMGAHFLEREAAEEELEGGAEVVAFIVSVEKLNIFCSISREIPAIANSARNIAARMFVVL
jgi:hypothetical protein